MSEYHFEGCVLKRGYGKRMMLMAGEKEKPMRKKIDESRLIYLYDEERMRLREIAEAMGRSYNEVHYRLMLLGRKHKPVEAEQMKKLLDQGLTSREIAKELRIHVASVYSLKRKFGFALNTRLRLVTFDSLGDLCCPFYDKFARHACRFPHRKEEQICPQWLESSYGPTADGWDKCDYAKRFMDVCVKRDWYALHLMRMSLPINLERGFQKALTAIFRNKYWGDISAKIGFALMKKCRTDTSCPYKALLPEYDVKEKDVEGGEVE